MAGDWIKMRTTLAADPAVIAMACALNLDEHTVVGKLHALWSWADGQCRDDGHAHGVTFVWLDRYVRADGFAASMEKVGWLIASDDGITFPKFDRHNTEPSKTRALAAKRKQKQRISERDGKRDISHASTVTREEKRREEENTPKPPFESSTFEQSFKEFWDVFPQNRDGKKPEVEECRIKFAHLPPHQWPDVIQAAKHYAASSSGVDGFVMKPAKFIYSGWADWTEPAKEPPGAGNKPISRAEMEEVNRRHQENSNRQRRAKV